MKVLSVKDLILGENKQAMHSAILNLVEELGYDRSILEALVTLSVAGKAKDSRELSKSLREIYKH